MDVAAMLPRPGREWTEGTAMASLPDHPHREPGADGTAAPPSGDGRDAQRSLQLWRAIARRSFAVLAHVTPHGQARCSGVVYATVGRRLYVATAPDSWKARHIAANGHVSMTIPVRRGGILSLVAPIPPATITLHGVATVHAPGSARSRSIAQELGALLPEDRRAAAAVIEIAPEGEFVTYGVGVPLTRLRDPAAAGRRVPVAAA
jgi:hypothetical protein